VQRLARGRGVGVYTLRDLVADESAWCENANHTLFLGYAALSEQGIRKGVADLAEAIAPRTSRRENRRSLRAA
jgi:DNA-binding transcriptional MocR family regulator